MKRIIISLLCAFLAVTVVSMICVMSARGQIDLYVTQFEDKQPDVRIEDPDVMELVSVDRVGEYDGGVYLYRIRVKGLKGGETVVHAGDSQLFCDVSRRTHAVRNESNRDFSGAQGVLISYTVLFIFLAISFWAYFHKLRVTDLYSYRTALIAGMSLYVTWLATVLSYICLRSALTLRVFTVSQTLSVLAGSCMNYIYITLPLLIAIAVSLAVSNVALVRHEGFRPRNMLGVMLLIVVVGGLTAAELIENSFGSGSFEEYRLHKVFSSAYTSLFVFAETMFLGSALCSYIAARHQPRYDKDFVIIHGCKIAADGTPLPLLRDRIDRALSFDAAQQAATGRRVTYVPSGGRGSDEIISEAQCIGDYLIAHGVEPGRILLEDRSTDTLENMRYSKQLIQAVSPNANTAFCTTNYHVFRCGALAADVGLKAEGMGSRTKWYFWPNAFMREFVGLIVQKRRPLSIILLLTVIFFMALNYFTAY